METQPPSAETELTLPPKRPSVKIIIVECVISLVLFILPMFIFAAFTGGVGHTFDYLGFVSLFASIPTMALLGIPIPILPIFFIGLGLHVIFRLKGVKACAQVWWLLLLLLMIFEGIGTYFMSFYGRGGAP
ncbi:MAG: hypothetical protein JXR84_17080 [Anaerolineae bacterium]|nr:hypothetical protein [Anaerolineae bacterium]